MSELKATIGAAFRFVWRAPGYVVPADQAVANQLALSVRYSAGAAAVTLSPLVEAASTITACSGRVLTAQAAPSAATAVGDDGAAWFKSDETGIIPVRVMVVSGSSITLADVPRSLPTAPTNGRLVWATWTGSVSDHAAERAVPWTVTYKPIVSGALTTRKAEGLISWVRQPFSTGLTHDLLCSMRPDLSANVPDREQGHGPLIQASEAELVALIRALWRERGLWEDSIVGQPEGLREVHADLAAARYHDETKPARAEVLRSRALGAVNPETGERQGGMLALVLRSVAVDTDGDGVVDDARDRATGPRSSDSSVRLADAPVNTREHPGAPFGFSIGMRH